MGDDEKAKRRAEWLRLKRADREEFMLNYRQESPNYPSGFVPADMIAMTGMILRELESDGVIVSDGMGGFAPA